MPPGIFSASQCISERLLPIARYPKFLPRISIESWASAPRAEQREHPGGYFQRPRVLARYACAKTAPAAVGDLLLMVVDARPSWTISVDLGHAE